MISSIIFAEYQIKYTWHEHIILYLYIFIYMYPSQQNMIMLRISLDFSVLYILYNCMFCILTLIWLL